MDGEVIMDVSDEKPPSQLQSIKRTDDKHRKRQRLYLLYGGLLSRSRQMGVRWLPLSTVYRSGQHSI